jgi:hypothetical protein
MRKTNMACSKIISFAEIVQGRDSSVRVTDDRLLYAVDLAMVGTGQSRDDAGKVTCHFEHLVGLLANRTFLSDWAIFSSYILKHSRV